MRTKRESVGPQRTNKRDNWKLYVIVLVPLNKIISQFFKFCFSVATHGHLTSRNKKLNFADNNIKGKIKFSQHQAASFYYYAWVSCSFVSINTTELCERQCSVKYFLHAIELSKQETKTLFWQRGTVYNTSHTIHLIIQVSSEPWC
jgi:hypothetical protein